MTFNKILIANRGEIACRIIRTAHALGYQTVAVFSDVDANSPHVALADEAVRLGPAPAAHSYLNIKRVLAAAARSGADAIHPGYGFLSENASFARAVIAAGLVWIGPPPEAMDVMGNKAAAKRAIASSAVPLVPGYADKQDDGALVQAAAELGYPVMVKAAAGGGGRGMRLVNSAENLPSALASARSASLKAYGSDELLLEKAIVNPRHVEFQIFGDQHGNIIHLGERDCSIQRRHQKVIEEAPSPAVSAELRAQMGAAAIAAARAVGYYSAGTVEFLLDADDNFYFIEMNTRLQVEHPVTECVTGLDLVEWMLSVAAGEPLPLTQEQVQLNGHAIEVRLYAESPANNFLPSTGTVWRYEPPTGEGVRVDDGIRSGLEISPYYDAMVAKIIVSGPTRQLANRRLQRALTNTVLLGVENNRAFLLDTLRHPIFAAGDATTSFIDTFPTAEAGAHSAQLTMLAAAIRYRLAQQATSGPSWGAQSASYCFNADKRTDFVQVDASESGLQLCFQDETFALNVLTCEHGALWFEIDSLRAKASYARAVDDALWVQFGDESGCFSDVLMLPLGSAETAGNGTIKAPMPGSILRVSVTEGDTVAKGAELVVLEAMKMEHAIVAPFDGVVTSLAVSVGQQMKPREVMVVLAEAIKET